MTIYVMGFDPGPTECAYAVVRSPGLRVGRARFIEARMLPTLGIGNRIHGILEHYEDRLGDAFDEQMYIAVESVGLVHRLQARHHLKDTAKVEGRIEEVCATHIDVSRIFSIEAVVWRSLLVRVRNASDATIKRALPTYVEDLPPRTNAHVRDAIGLAFIASRDFARKAKTINGAA